MAPKGTIRFNAFNVHFLFIIFAAAVILYFWLKAVSFDPSVWKTVQQSDVGSVVGSSSANSTFPVNLYIHSTWEFDLKYQVSGL